MRMYFVNDDYQWGEKVCFNSIIILAHDLELHYTRHFIHDQYVLRRLTRFQKTCFIDGHTLHPEARQAAKFVLLMSAFIISHKEMMW